MGQRQTIADGTWERPNAIQPDFKVTRKSELSGWFSTGGPLRKIESTVLLLKVPETASRGYKASQNYKATDTMRSDHSKVVGDDGNQQSVGENWLSVVSATLSIPEIWVPVLEEVREYAALEAEWRGPGTKAVSDEIASQAKTLVRNLAVCLPDGLCPMIGSDDDGYIVMTWYQDDLVGNLSVLGKGVFAYYVRRGGKIAKNGKAQIGAPIPDDLSEALNP